MPPNNLGSQDDGAITDPTASATITAALKGLLSLITSTAPTEHTEDAAHSSGDKGPMLLAVRKDSATALAGADGDYIPLIVDANGKLWVAGAAGVQYDEDDGHTSGDTGTLLLAVRKDSAAALAGADEDYIPLTTDANGKLWVAGAAGTEFNEDDAHSSGDAGRMILAVRKDAAGALAGTDGDYIPLTTDANGKLWVAGAAGTEFNEDDAHSSGDAGRMILAVRQDTAAALATADGDYIPLIVDASGRLHVAPMPGVDIGDVDVLTINSVAPQFDDTDKLAVSLWGKDSAAGDKEINVSAAGNVEVDVASALPAGANNIGKSDAVAATPTSYNVTLTNADAEYSQALPSNCRHFEFQNRGSNITRYAFASGKVATPTAPFHTLKAGDYYYSPPINQLGSPSTLYLGSPDAGTVVEILAWV